MAKAPSSESTARIEERVAPGDARAAGVARGELIEVQDLQGCQVSDLLAFHAERPGEGINTAATRALCDGIFPDVGQQLHDAAGEALLTLLEDDVRRHDTFGIACNREYYEAHGQPDHPNCTDNFNRELGAFGYEPRRFWEPINWFYNTVIGPDGRLIEIRPSVSKAGDRVLLRAETDLVVAASACPDDIAATNGFNPTDVAFRVYPAPPEDSDAAAA